MRYGHQELDRLWAADQRARQLFHGEEWDDDGLGAVGLIFNSELIARAYEWCTPLNCLTFAGTGGDGNHFSLIAEDGVVNVDLPVVITNPSMLGRSLILGANVHEFLCLGVRCGYFCLEQLFFDLKSTLEICVADRETSAAPKSEEIVPPHQARLLDFLSIEFALEPWPCASRFEELQLQFGPLLVYPPALYRGNW